MSKQRCASVCHQQCAKDANHEGDHANGNYGWNDGAAEQWAADERRKLRERAGSGQPCRCVAEREGLARIFTLPADRLGGIFICLDALRALPEHPHTKALRRLVEALDSVMSQKGANAALYDEFGTGSQESYLRSWLSMLSAAGLKPETVAQARALLGGAAPGSATGAEPGGSET